MSVPAETSPASESGEPTMIESDAPNVVRMRDSGGLRAQDVQAIIAEAMSEKPGGQRPLIDKRVAAYLGSFLTILATAVTGGNYAAMDRDTTETEETIRKVVKEEINAAMVHVNRDVQKDRKIFADKIHIIGVNAAKTTAIESKVISIEGTVNKVQQDVAVLKDRSDR